MNAELYLSRHVDVDSNNVPGVFLSSNQTLLGTIIAHIGSASVYLFTLVQFAEIALRQCLEN